MPINPSRSEEEEKENEASISKINVEKEQCYASIQ